MDGATEWENSPGTATSNPNNAMILHRSRIILHQFHQCGVTEFVVVILMCVFMRKNKTQVFY